MTNQLDLTKPLRTRNGHAVRIYATDGKGNFPIHGAIQIGDSWSARTWTQQGCVIGTGIMDTEDLINTPSPPRELWINVYPDGYFIVWSSFEDAERGARSDRIGRNRVVLREEFDEA